MECSQEGRKPAGTRSLDCMARLVLLELVDHRWQSKEECTLVDHTQAGSHKQDYMELDQLSLVVLLYTLVEERRQCRLELAWYTPPEAFRLEMAEDRQE